MSCYKYESLELAKGPLKISFQLKTCSRLYVRESRTLAGTKKSSTKDSGKERLKYTFIPVFIINKSPRYGACDWVVIITRLLGILSVGVTDSSD